MFKFFSILSQKLVTGGAFPETESGQSQSHHQKCGDCVNSLILLSEIEDKLDEINSSLSSDVSSLNTILSTINANVATNNTASASGVLSQKLSWIGNSLIGATNATGGSATSGTVMAKLNALLGTGSKLKLKAGSTAGTKFTNQISEYVTISGRNYTI